jgi:hypothetical protein
VILQPNLLSLDRESRNYYVRGAFCKSVFTQRGPAFGLSAAVGGRQLGNPNVMGDVSVTEIDLGTNSGDYEIRRVQLSMPIITDKIHHVKQLLEKWNKLVSRSGMIRFDFGLETINAGEVQNYGNRVDIDAKERIKIMKSELNECCKQPIPAQWSGTGRGWIVRTFLNEVFTSARSRSAINGAKSVESASVESDIIRSCSVKPLDRDVAGSDVRR